RYATQEDWLIWKGANVFKDPDGYGQFLDICRDLITKAEYSGPDFSWGDAEIFEKATNGGSPGNAETWRRIGTNHHIEMVLAQIASLP
ncbi:MAG: beta family protein, partial [Nitrososphaerales archaeon]